MREGDRPIGVRGARVGAAVAVGDGDRLGRQSRRAGPDADEAE